MRVFFSAPHNRPSGGIKYLNLFVNLFVEKGYESYLVLPRKPSKASFLINPAPVIDIDTMKEICSREDIVIDNWQLREIWEASRGLPAKQKVFWHHGCHIPLGKGYVGEKVYSKDSFYTQYWNVSKACANYINETYNIESNVVPLFSPGDPQELFSRGWPYSERDGILVVWARGQSMIPAIFKEIPLSSATAVFPGYHESEWYDLLARHRIFLSVDQGIKSTSLPAKIRKRISGGSLNYWKTPKTQLLGFPTPAFEAALCGCVVVGSAMGGGLEWMRKDNCFLAEDLNMESLIEETARAARATARELEDISRAAFLSVRKFTKERSWLILSQLLGL